MLTRKQINEVRSHLERAQNPLFYYDNDADGLCSFLLFRRFLGRGKGVAVKSYPDLNAQYARKAEELRADYIFLLDKPVISREFIEEIERMQLPIVWIDHHDILLNDVKFFKKFKNMHIFNPSLNKGKNKSNEPVTYLAYKVADRKEDLWIAVMGCIADHFLPDFSKEFARIYPDYWSTLKIKEPFEAYYKTEIGRIARSLSFGLKDSISRVVELQNFLISCKGPGDVLLESESNKSFRERYCSIKQKYDILLESARQSFFDNLLFFSYSGELSISAELSNELSFLYPKKYIGVAYMKGTFSNVSLRGKNVKAILERILSKFDNSSGGGHKDAVGARIQSDDLARFREILQNEVKNE